MKALLLMTIAILAGSAFAEEMIFSAKDDYEKFVLTRIDRVRLKDLIYENDHKFKLGRDGVFRDFRYDNRAVELKLRSEIHRLPDC